MQESSRELLRILASGQFHSVKLSTVEHSRVRFSVNSSMQKFLPCGRDCRIQEGFRQCILESVKFYRVILSRAEYSRMENVVL